MSSSSSTASASYDYANSSIITSSYNGTTTSSSCPAATRQFVTTDAAPFWNTKSIIRGHDTLRFGYSNNITLAIVGTHQDRYDYAVGLLAAAIVMLSFFGMWLIAIVTLKCLGHRLVGFLSGTKVSLPSRPLPPDQRITNNPRSTSVLSTSNLSYKDAQENHSSVVRVNDKFDDDEYVTAEMDGSCLLESATGRRSLRNEDVVESKTDSGVRSSNTRIEDNENDDEEKLGDLELSEKSLKVRRQNPNHNGLSSADVALGGSTAPNNNQSEPKQSQEDNVLDYEKELEQWKHLVKTRQIRIARIRVAVLVSGVIIVVMAVLMIVYGIQRLSNSVSDSVNGIDQALALCDSAVSIIDSFLLVRNDTAAVAQAASVETNYTICPSVEEVICGGSSCASVLRQVSDYFSQNQIVYDSLSAVQHDVLEIKSILTSIDQSITSFDYAFWIAAAAVSLLAVCTIVLMNGVILAWRRKVRSTCWHRTSSRFRGWMVVPTFVILLVVGWICSMVVVIGSTASADFCFDSPNQNVLAFLNEIKDNFNSFLYPMLVFYVSGCPDLSVVQSSALQNVQLMLNLLAQSEVFLDSVANHATAIASVCGTDPTVVTLLLQELDALLCYGSSTIFDTVDFFTCSNWNGLYASVMYSAVCYNGNTGFAWIAVAQFIILLCSMIMLTLRVAFYELVDESELVPVRTYGSRCKRFWRRCFCSTRSNLEIEKKPIVRSSTASSTTHQDMKVLPAIMEVRPDVSLEETKVEPPVSSTNAVVAVDPDSAEVKDGELADDGIHACSLYCGTMNP